MPELLLFLGGWAWTALGLGVLSVLDPEGQHDDWVMGPGNSLWFFALSLLFWPVTALRMGRR